MKPLPTTVDRGFGCLGSRLLWTVTLASSTLHFSALSAFAQKPVKAPPDEGSVLQWIVALGLMVVIGFSAFLNPKRSHRA